MNPALVLHLDCSQVSSFVHIIDGLLPHHAHMSSSEIEHGQQVSVWLKRVTHSNLPLRKGGESIWIGYCGCYCLRAPLVPLRHG